MSSRLGGGTDHDAESGQPLVADPDDAPSTGSALKGPVATSLSFAGSALERLRRAVRAVGGPSQHAGFELVRSADGERKQQDPDDERDATGAASVALNRQVAWESERRCGSLAAAGGAAQERLRTDMGPALRTQMPLRGEASHCFSHRAGSWFQP